MSYCLESCFIKAPFDKYCKLFTTAEAEEIYRKLKIRLESLESPEYQTQKFYRILIDYLLRQGYFKTAKKLTAKFDLEDHIDFDIYENYKQIEASLLRRETASCLEWCKRNKIKSQLEFLLRRQEFVELVRNKELEKAIEYSRVHLAKFIDKYQAQVQRAMALLAGVDSIQYKFLYDLERWADIIIQFKQDNNALFSLTDGSSLVMHLEAGLSALKCPSCYQNDSVPDCPVCSEFHQFAESLPFSHHENSSMVCRVTKRVMNEDNPPLALPNGQIYSSEAIERLIDDDGNIKCPVTQDRYTMDDIKKCFIV